MDRRLAPLLIIPLLLASFLAGWHLGQPDYLAGPYEGRSIQVQLEVYKNGELVYYDPDDPAVSNILKVFAWLFRTDETSGAFSATASNGGVFTFNYAYQMNNIGAAAVAVSDGVANFTRDMYTLPGNVYYTQVADTNVILGPDYIQVSGSVTLTSQVNITWVGLYVSLGNEGFGIPNGEDILIFADPLPAPIQVSANDVITVVYKIVVP